MKKAKTSKKIYKRHKFCFVKKKALVLNLISFSTWFIAAFRAQKEGNDFFENIDHIKIYENKTQLLIIH
jgi:hypothetical protein